MIRTARKSKDSNLKIVTRRRQKPKRVDPINSADQDGRTTLINATISNCQSIIDDLLSSRANVNIQDKDGRTALIHASKLGHVDIASQLLDAKADVSLVDKEKKNAFMISKSSKIKALLAPLYEEIPEHLAAELRNKSKFAESCRIEGDRHKKRAISSTDDSIILHSASEAIRYYELALQHEPFDLSLQAAKRSASDFYNRLGILIDAHSQVKSHFASSLKHPDQAQDSYDMEGMKNKDEEK
mmetsp:Transcript_21620/g.34913  ORF Transcript_21620/g.34913 Transcript_21620/m.34913 type:complete len:242 (+) Transcript_21620:131-856(+)